MRSLRTPETISRCEASGRRGIPRALGQRGGWGDGSRGGDGKIVVEVDVLPAETSKVTSELGYE